MTSHSLTILGWWTRRRIAISRSILFMRCFESTLSFRMSLIATYHQHCRERDCVSLCVIEEQYLHTVSGCLTWFRPSPTQLDLSKLSFSQCLSKDVVPKPDFAVPLRASSRRPTPTGSR